jgi:uncharacterized pyridoxamine 5'-phosphate oxidase family protein
MYPSFYTMLSKKTKIVIISEKAKYIYSSLKQGNQIILQF